MVVCEIPPGIVCIFGTDGEYRWRSSNKSVEEALNRSYVFRAPVEDPDPFLTVAKRVCAILEHTGMRILKNQPPEIKEARAGVIV